MSEQFNGLDQQPKHEALPAGGEHLLPDAEHAQPLGPEESNPLQRLETARLSAEQAAGRDNPFQRLEAAEKAPQAPASDLPINQELKRITLQRELGQLRRQLPLPDRLLSRVIHQPLVRTLSEATGKSLTRPSGLLGGSLVAFLGSSSYLYLAKHIGFTYNYLVFWLLFLGGFVFGLLLEILIWLFASHRNSN